MTPIPLIAFRHPVMELIDPNVLEDQSEVLVGFTTYKSGRFRPITEEALVSSDCVTAIKDTIKKTVKATIIALTKSKQTELDLEESKRIKFMSKLVGKCGCTLFVQSANNLPITKTKHFLMKIEKTAKAALLESTLEKPELNESQQLDSERVALVTLDSMEPGSELLKQVGSISALFAEWGWVVNPIPSDNQSSLNSLLFEVKRTQKVALPSLQLEELRKLEFKELQRIVDMPRVLTSWGWIAHEITSDQLRPGDLVFVKKISAKIPVSHILMTLFKTRMFHCALEHGGAKKEDIASISESYIFPTDVKVLLSNKDPRAAPPSLYQMASAFISNSVSSATMESSDSEKSASSSPEMPRARTLSKPTTISLIDPELYQPAPARILGFQQQPGIEDKSRRSLSLTQNGIVNSPRFAGGRPAPLDQKFNHSWNKITHQTASLEEKNKHESEVNSPRSASISFGSSIGELSFITAPASCSPASSAHHSNDSSPVTRAKMVVFRALSPFEEFLLGGRRTISSTPVPAIVEVHSNDSSPAISAKKAPQFGRGSRSSSPYEELLLEDGIGSSGEEVPASSKVHSSSENMYENLLPPSFDSSTSSPRTSSRSARSSGGESSFASSTTSPSSASSVNTSNGRVKDLANSHGLLTPPSFDSLTNSPLSGASSSSSSSGDNSFASSPASFNSNFSAYSTSAKTGPQIRPQAPPSGPVDGFSLGRGMCSGLDD